MPPPETGKSDVELANCVADYVLQLLNGAELPQIPRRLFSVKGIVDVHNSIAELRGILNDFARGVFTRHITMRGVAAGRLKALQANLNHLTWQITQIANGDFTQRVDFMGDFSVSFNQMVQQLDGALTELRKKEEELTALTRMLEFEVEQRGNALNRLRISEAKFKYLAEHDSLTGVLNRRSFMQLAEGELHNPKTVGHSCCVALLDIDRFKLFNDTYGHLEGDKGIRHVTDIAKNSLRQIDFIGRYGGEEFIMLYSNADLDQGIIVAERIRKGVVSTPLPVAGKNVTMSVSIGIVHIPGQRRVVESSDPAHLLQLATGAADEALYEAKNSGRNVVRFRNLPEYCTVGGYAASS